MITETVYLGDSLGLYKNTIRWLVLTDEAKRTVVDITAITRTQLLLVSSTSAVPLVFDTNTPEHAGLFAWQPGGIIALTLGAAPGLTAGKWAGRLALYDASGRYVWDTIIQLNVIQL